MGSLREPARRMFVQQVGRQEWKRHVRAVDRMWETMRRVIASLNLDYATVRLYQDGLPNCGHEEEIVRKVAQAGSENHRILLELMEKGAKLIGTESPELLLEEYRLTKQTLRCINGRGTAAPDPGLKETARRVLDRRDQYIAERIDRTLPRGETGLIFLGKLHSLQDRLPPDILVILVDPTPATVKGSSDHAK